MVEMVKVVKTKDGFILTQFGEIPQMVEFSIGGIHTYMYDILSRNVELFHAQHEAYRNPETAFSIIIQTIKEAIDSYCYPITFDTLPMECIECIYDKVHEVAERC